MSIVTTAGGYSYLSYPVTKEQVFAHTLQTVDGGVHIDSTNNNLDNAHLILNGNLPQSEYYLRCHDLTENVFTIDGDGDVKCAAVEAASLKLPQIANVETQIGLNSSNLALDAQLIQVIQGIDSAQDTKITNLETVVEAATRLKGGDTLVKRGQSSGTEIEYCKVNQLHALTPNANISVFGDGTFNWVAMDSSGNNQPNSLYRFGRNTTDLGDNTGAGDGLEIVRNDNTCLISCTKHSATIKIEGEKMHL